MTEIINDGLWIAIAVVAMVSIVLTQTVSQMWDALCGRLFWFNVLIPYDPNSEQFFQNLVHFLRTAETGELHLFELEGHGVALGYMKQPYICPLPLDLQVILQKGVVNGHRCRLMTYYEVMDAYQCFINRTEMNYLC